MNRRYASQTIVSEEKSRMDLERLLVRYGATGFVYGWQDSVAVLGFKYDNTAIRMGIPIPSLDKFAHDGRGHSRSEGSKKSAWEQAKRQIWRALLLIVQAKFEAILAGLTTFDQEFLSFIQLPDGNTVGSYILPQIESARDGGKFRLALPGLGETTK